VPWGLQPGGEARSRSSAAPLRGAEPGTRVFSPTRVALRLVLQQQRDNLEEGWHTIASSPAVEQGLSMTFWFTPRHVRECEVLHSLM